METLQDIVAKLKYNKELFNMLLQTLHVLYTIGFPCM